MDKKLRARIEALLAMAEDKGASENEKEIAMRRALALLVAAGVTREEFKGEAADELVGEGVWSTTTYARRWCRSICRDVARLYFCDYLYRTKGNGVSHIFVGRESNVLVAQSIALMLCASIKRQGLALRKNDYAGQTAFFAGAEGNIFKRCEALIADAMSEGLDGGVDGPITALAVVNAYKREENAVAAYIGAAYPKLRENKAKSKIITDVESYRLGSRIANDLPLRPQLDAETSAPAHVAIERK